MTKTRRLLAHRNVETCLASSRFLLGRGIGFNSKPISNPAATIAGLAGALQRVSDENRGWQRQLGGWFGRPINNPFDQAFEQFNVLARDRPNLGPLDILPRDAVLAHAQLAARPGLQGQAGVQQINNALATGIPGMRPGALQLADLPNLFHSQAVDPLDLHQQLQT